MTMIYVKVSGVIVWFGEVTANGGDVALEYVRVVLSQ
jgi:hypothetical protein